MEAMEARRTVVVGTTGVLAVVEEEGSTRLLTNGELLQQDLTAVIFRVGMLVAGLRHLAPVREGLLHTILPTTGTPTPALGVEPLTCGATSTRHPEPIDINHSPNNSLLHELRAYSGHHPTLVHPVSGAATAAVAGSELRWVVGRCSWRVGSRPLI